MGGGLGLSTGRFRLHLFALGISLLLLVALKDTRPRSALESYDYAKNLFQSGRLADSQHASELGYEQFGSASPDWAHRFELMEAEAMVWRGMYDDALRLLAFEVSPDSSEDAIRQLAIQAIALSHRQQDEEASRKLSQAAGICKTKDIPVCGEVIRARGILDVRNGLLEKGREELFQSYSFAQAHHDNWLKANADVNLGWAAIQSGHFDESVDWSNAGWRAAVALDAAELVQLSSGNLGWAYLQLGDTERALGQFLEAEKSARKLGDLRRELVWTTAAGYVYRDTGDLPRATEAYRQAFNLAKQLDSKEDIVNALEDLAQASVESGKLNEASGYIDKVTALEGSGGNRLSANALLTQGMLAAARHQKPQAESLFRQVQADTSSPTTTRLTAGYQLATLYELEGDKKSAEKIYKATLHEFDSARAQLKSEESQLPFVANAANIYDDYIQLLVQQGRSDEALELADQSRARTLAQALDGAEGKSSLRTASMNPRQIAVKTGATLLFYWLGDKQSYLWAITPSKIKLFPLAPQQQIREQVERYNKFVLDLHDPLKTNNQDGQTLYNSLVAPASALIRTNAPVMILADGALSQLNFETLLVPGPSHGPIQNSGPVLNQHYLLEDATLLSVPSLAMLAAAKPVHASDRSLLLLGNPVSPSDEFPSLPLFGFEMTRIKKHFTSQDVAVFDGQRATPAAYLSSNPSHYSYIHFVSHAVASRTDPLDSAIILSNAKPGEDSFKLYARDIMQHSIGARLVTISACYGSGTRSYAGEGLVGLSWAFLRAGARSVIAALWEVSDDSTPKLMDTLYGGIESGLAPAVALRKAKLDLIHSQNRFSAPFYWAPFQVYTTQ